MSEHFKNQLEIMNQQVKELAALYHGAASNKAGKSVNEFWIWYALLVLGGEYSQQDICDTWSLPKQTVNTIITNLVKKGYMTLEADPGTRNRKIIRVSEEGKVYGEKIVMPVYEAEVRAIKQISEKERVVFISMLGKYIDLLKKEIEAL